MLCLADMPTGSLVSWIAVPDPAISLTFSPMGDFLASAHIDNLGIFLWSNRTMFTGVSHSSAQAVFEAQEVSLPLTKQTGLSTTGEETTLGSELVAADATSTTEQEDKDMYGLVQTPEQIDGTLVTLSSLPRSRWENLANLDAIKQRNKPKEPPKAPERAPFFLSTIPGLANKQLDLSVTGLWICSVPPT